MLDFNKLPNNSREGFEYTSGTFFKDKYLEAGELPYYDVRISGFCARDLRIANSNEFGSLVKSFHKY